MKDNFFIKLNSYEGILSGINRIQDIDIKLKYISYSHIFNTLGNIEKVNDIYSFLFETTEVINEKFKLNSDTIFITHPWSSPNLTGNTMHIEV